MEQEVALHLQHNAETEILQMTRPKLLDLYCGAGGASYGYMLAGFDVTGVDLYPQKRYPRNDHMRFVQGDAIEYILAHGWEYDAIHASPPCQTHSTITPDKSKHLDLIPQTRYALECMGVPYIIENVPGAKKALRNPVMLCGADFGLKVYRHRLFESNVMLLVPPHIKHTLPSDDEMTLTPEQQAALDLIVAQDKRHFDKHGKHRYTGDTRFVTVAGHITGRDYAAFAMGIDWMDTPALAQAIPPAYTHYLGKQLMQHVLHRRESAEREIAARAEIVYNSR
jgi:DNA (cytosine-5)-methyltransferase 1